MLLALLLLQTLVLIVVVVLLLRNSAGAATTADPRLNMLLAADLPELLTRSEAATEAKLAALDAHLRAELSELRTEARADAQNSREAADKAATNLRTEVLSTIGGLSDRLNTGFDNFRTDNKTDAAALRAAVDKQMDTFAQRFTRFTAELNDSAAATRDNLNRRLNEHTEKQAELGDKLRDVLQQSLNKLNTDNSAKLDQMRETVDEKLQKTLNERITQSYGQVSDQLGAVQKGLGEMKELATGVGDLKRVLTNVKARGIVGEFQLGQQLEQMFSPEQYVKNAVIRPDTRESVEYALKFPNGPSTTVLLAIDSKFPREDWERLEQAYEIGTPEEIASAGKAFERAIRAEGKKICEKYIDPPTTLPHAIMFLPTEGLYAEVVRRPGLQSELQQQCRVTIAGPSTFMAILTSFQMGFHTLALEKKGNEVWNVLGRAKTEFEKFGGMMERVEKQVGTVQTTLREIRGKSTTITRSLKNVASIDTGAQVDAPLLADSVLPMLAANEEE